MVPIHHSWLFFPKKSGLISGIIIAGFGAGPLIFDNLATKIINPGNEKQVNDYHYPSDVDARFKHMMRILVLLWGFMVVFAVVTIFQGPIKED